MVVTGAETGEVAVTSDMVDIAFVNSSG